MNVVIGSESPAKLEAVRKVFKEFFKTKFVLHGVKTKSGVEEAPHDEATYRGALLRANTHAKSGIISIGIESGIATRFGLTFEEAWAVIVFDTKIYAGYSSGLMLPDKLLNVMREQGLTHDQAIKKFDTQKERSQKDTWSVYTNGKLSRKLSLEEALRNAMLQLYIEESIQ